MRRPGQPLDLKKYMDRKPQIKLNANRIVVGTLSGFDRFMNLMADNTVVVNGMRQILFLFKVLGQWHQLLMMMV
ncbi:hypothetical protein Ddye_032311 [Dipteronia dyeriana]|uniref:Sm protein G n=1 Tax=Dipteronia dyeriana TaxID=168575 RepID=A0AAD9TKY7_9ROSI|nr:hypothetical protein Ddye_032311 [Dipteronia dyeriana]